MVIKVLAALAGMVVQAVTVAGAVMATHFIDLKQLIHLLDIFRRFMLLFIENMRLPVDPV